MNKFYILLLSILCFSITAKAQTEFAPLGAEWSYKSTTWNDMHGVNRTEYWKIYSCIADSADGQTRYLNIRDIDNKQYLRYNLYSRQLEYFDRVADTSFLELKVTEDTIFYKNPVFGKYTPLYIFNVNEGDTLRIPITDTLSNPYDYSGSLGNVFHTPEGDSVITFIVDSIINKDYNGTMLETFYVRTLAAKDSQGQPLYPLFNWSVDILGVNAHSYFDTVSTTGAYTRLFGGLGAGILPMQFKHWIGVDDIYHRSDTLCMYEDSLYTISGSNNPSNCGGFDVNVPLNSIKTIQAGDLFKIYPNPLTGGILHLKSEKVFAANTSLIVTDLLGKTVHQQKIIQATNEQSLDLSKLQSGLYVLILETEGQRFYHKISVK